MFVISVNKSVVVLRLFRKDCNFFIGFARLTNIKRKKSRKTVIKRQVKVTNQTEGDFYYNAEMTGKDITGT